MAAHSKSRFNVVKGPACDSKLGPYSWLNIAKVLRCGGKGELSGTKEAEMGEIKYDPIGIIHSPYHEIKGMPIHPARRWV